MEDQKELLDQSGTESKSSTENRGTEPEVLAENPGTETTALTEKMETESKESDKKTKSDKKKQKAPSKQKELEYTGRIGQTFVYLGKLFRMFIFQSDWKVIPMAALIAGLVSMAIGNGLFTTQEGTLQGTFALACVCIWNGFFNSIQVICRERPIIKREHRAGMHITSYVAAHLIYQFVLCIAQSIITIVVLNFTQVKLDLPPLVSEDFKVDLFITLLLITFSADTLALLVSAIVHSTTTAMTVMPFLLIVQLVFAGFFSLPDTLQDLSNTMISKWGVQCLCAIGNYNEQPAVVIWNKLAASGKSIELAAGYTMWDVIHEVEAHGYRDQVLAELGKANYNAKYESTVENVFKCWGSLLIFAFIFSFATVAFLEYIDRDKR